MPQTESDSQWESLIPQNKTTLTPLLSNMGQQKSGALLTISPLKKHLIWLQTIKHMAAAFNTTNTQYASGSDKNQKKYFSSSVIIVLSSFNSIILIHISIQFQFLLVLLLYMRLRASKSGRDWEEVNYHKALKMWFCSGNFLAPSRRRQNEKKTSPRLAWGTRQTEEQLLASPKQS